MPGIGFTISCTRYAAMSVQGTKVMVPVAKCNMSSKKKEGCGAIKWLQSWLSNTPEFVDQVTQIVIVQHVQALTLTGTVQKKANQSVRMIVHCRQLHRKVARLQREAGSLAE